jgi:hypothetical protein
MKIVFFMNDFICLFSDFGYSNLFRIWQEPLLLSWVTGLSRGRISIFGFDSGSAALSDPFCTLSYNCMPDPRFPIDALREAIRYASSIIFSGMIKKRSSLVFFAASS